MVRDWDHVSYLAFFYSADLYWLQLALLVLAFVIRLLDNGVICD